MIALALAAAVSCGDVDASDYAVHYASAQGAEAVSVNTLAEFYNVEAGSQQSYQYAGTAYVTYVDGASGQVFLAFHGNAVHLFDPASENNLEWPSKQRKVDSENFMEETVLPD